MPTKKRSRASRPQAKVPTGRVPGVPVPSTERSAAASRVNAWKSGRYSRNTTADDVENWELANAKREAEDETLRQSPLAKARTKLTGELWRALRLRALEENRDPNAMLAELVDEYLRRGAERPGV